jgi:hypothetical protein
MPIPKDWLLDDPLPNPYSAFPSVVSRCSLPARLSGFDKRRKSRAPTIRRPSPICGHRRRSLARRIDAAPPEEPVGWGPSPNSSRSKF